MLPSLFYNIILLLLLLIHTSTQQLTCSNYSIEHDSSLLSQILQSLVQLHPSNQGGTPPNSTDNFYYSCLTRSSNTTLYRYSAITVTYTNNIDSYYAQFVLECNSNTNWEIITKPTTRMVLTGSEVFITSPREDCYSCEIPFLTSGCQACPDTCPDPSNSSQGYCYNTTANNIECCPYQTMDNACLASCPNNFAPDTNFQCTLCTFNWEGPNCDVCSLNCGSGGTPDVSCQFCQCSADFELINATHCSQIDDCASQPCLNDATCIDGINTFTCICVNEDFHGDRCQNQHTPCVSRPCLNGGTCIDMIGEDQFTCYCTEGYEGDICQIDTYDCPVGACLPGICIDGFHNYTCVCPVDYQLIIRPNMRFCEEIDDCEVSFCMHGGVCIDGNASSSCNCTNTGYTDEYCDVDVNECRDNIHECVNGATCVNTLGSYVCVCGSLYSGDFCELCDPGCINGTTNSSDCMCSCNPGYDGTLCDMFTGLCEIDSCFNGGVCTNHSHAVECNCENTGYTGARCEIDFDECQDTSTCLNGGTCINEDGTFSCQCSERFSGDICQICDLTCVNGHLSSDCNCVCNLDFTGNRCESRIDNCIGVFCLHGGRCVDQVNDFLCDCTNTGFTGSICQTDINECFLTPPCQNSGTCQNTPGSYTCQCHPGFHGTHCEQCTISCNNGGTRDICRCVCAPGYEGQFCDDVIDNCLSNSCFNGGTCINQVNAFTCQCPIGFYGNTCDLTFPNPCDPNLCQNNGTCNRISNTDYACTCASNYSGRNCTIPGIACSLISCTSNQTCIDHSNHFSCECRNGYERIRDIVDDCYDIDECVLYPNVCGDYPATCTNLIGEPLYYNCSCPLWFESSPSQLFESPLNYCTDNNCQPTVCIDSNECDLLGSIVELCPPTMKCSDTKGSFICVCENGTFQNGMSCVSATQSSGFDCQLDMDSSGNIWLPVSSDSTVTSVCSNTEFGLAYRSCIAPCECTTDRGDWSIPDLSKCISVGLISLRAEILSIRHSQTPNATHFYSIVDNFRELAANNLINGGDLSFSVIILFELLETLKTWPSSQEILITSRLLDDFLEIAEYLISKPESDWLETRNLTLSLLSLSEIITQFTNQIAIYIYQNGIEVFTYSSQTLSIEVLTWNEYQLTPSGYITHAPTLSNSTLLIPKVRDPIIIGIELPQTPQNCHLVFWKLYLPTFHTLLTADLLFKMTQPRECLTSYSRTTQSFNIIRSNYLAAGFNSPICTLHSSFATPNDLPFIFRQLSNTLTTNTFEIVYYPTSQTYDANSSRIFPTAICNESQLILSEYMYSCAYPSQPFAIIEITQEDTPYEQTAIGLVFRILTVISITLLSVSLLLILSTLITYIDGILFVRVNTIIALLLTQLVFVVGIDRNELQILCTIISILLHYLILCSALWSLLDIINCTLVIIMKWTRHKIAYTVYCSIAYILPLIYVAIITGASFCSYHRPRDFCLISPGTDSAILLTVIAPLVACVLVLLIATIVMVVALFAKREKNLTFTEFEDYLKVAFSLLSSVLLPVFVLASWILSVYAFSLNYTANVLQISFIVTSVVIGPYVLIVYTLGSANEVHKLYGKRKLQEVEDFRNFNMEISTLNPLFHERLADWNIMELHSKQTDVSLSETSSTTDSL